MCWMCDADSSTSRSRWRRYARNAAISPLGRKLARRRPNSCRRCNHWASLTSADSSGRRNSLCLLPFIDGSEEFVQGLGRRFPAKSFAGPGVEGERDGCQGIGIMHAEVGSLGKVLAQQPVGVLVRAALPGAVRVTEVDLDPPEWGKIISTFIQNAGAWNRASAIPRICASAWALPQFESATRSGATGCCG